MEYLRQNDSELQCDINLSWIPPAALIVAAVTCISSYAMFVGFGYFDDEHLPTFSETARYYPMTRVFAIGFAIFSVLFFVGGEMMCELLKLDNVEHYRIYKVVPAIGSALAVAMSSVGLSDQSDLHGTFAVAMFVVMLGFCIFIYVSQKRNNAVMYGTMKLVLLVISSLMLLVVAVLAPIEEEGPVMSYVKAASEYVLAISLFLCIGVWKSDLSFLQLTLVVEE